MQRFKGGVAQEDSARTLDPLRLATAAVLLDIGHADGTLSTDEVTDLVGHLKQAFELDDAMARELMAAADEVRKQSIDHFALTNFIRHSASLPDRIAIVRTMWRMVYSDRKLSDYENYLVRKLADLLGIEHHVMIEVKVDVLRELGLATN